MKNKISIDDEIQHVLIVLSTFKPDSNEYTAAVKNLKELCEARSKKAARLIDIDTIIAAGTGVLQVLLIMGYERLNVISTKAISFVTKGRI